MGFIIAAAVAAAIIAFSRALAKQVASKGIRVNVVAPGPVWTPLQVTGGHCAARRPPEHAPVEN